MNYKDLRIVFMGTPVFAVASLNALVNAGCNIVAVVTAPDKPAGRGLQLNESAIKKYAVANNLKILQPVKLKSVDFIETLKSLKADVQIVVAFRMLPEMVWNMPTMGTINVHGSLLPQYRGAAPINWAVINGEKFTGVTTFKLKHAIDTGNILLQESLAIDENETAGEVHDKMKELGAELLLKTIQQLAEGKLIEQEQNKLNNTLTLKHAPKLYSENGKIDFSKTVEEVHNLVRGLSPFPGAYTFLNNKLLKIYRTIKEVSDEPLEVGSIKSDGKKYFKMACCNGYINILELQLEGKKRMKIEDFLRGNKIQ
ncbi:MAG TPA: methionyl-tRNA formyltransferase [Chitinophagaceae bacterium]|nr:methionyl-tRNA formyltransferase [Chitinophagaceae bacterium]HNJ57821.1 methionyl-tRNA formyltransferase [Chitinophagaceae bacterium]HNM35271.1 methionyl-tRNA formyltransferase [Chitinophagaceae bacterium]